MGVSGSGKSTVGTILAERLGVPFIDADDLHPAANIIKMTAGMPLDDDDRWPWLAIVGHRLATASGGLVVACSALRLAYRDAIRELAPEARFVHLEGSVELLTARVSGRLGHFMPATLLSSQREALEALAANEGVVVDIAGEPHQVAELAAVALAASV